MLDDITGDNNAGGWGLPDQPVVADASYGDATEFRLGLANVLRAVTGIRFTGLPDPRRHRLALNQAVRNVR